MKLKNCALHTYTTENTCVGFMETGEKSDRNTDYNKHRITSATTPVQKPAQAKP
jgi:hypothetical protein